MKISIRLLSTIAIFFNDTKNYIQRIAPEKADIVSFYQNGSPIFDSVWDYQTGKSFFWQNSKPSTAALTLLLNILKRCM